MELIHQVIDIVLHLDTHLQSLTTHYGSWVYVILFLIVFMETGLVVTPFLPGDSLLFAAGSIAAITSLNVHWLAISLTIAAILGDSLNYAIGKWVGPKVFTQEKSLFFNKDYLMRAEAFYEKYGAKAIIIARFIPIIRTFAPFVAGIGIMQYKRFLAYNIIGAILWVYSFLYVSYFFGNLPVIKENFSIIVLVIIVLSILPALVDFYRQKKNRPLLKINNKDNA